MAAQAPLRVGTTGDYAPFSLSVDDDFQGLDILLAHRFAESLGRRVQFTQTTWPSLLADADARQFDMALSGITVTEARSRQVVFSLPYYQGRKLALVRCDELEQHGDLDDLDRPNVEVLTNPGGTNESFVRQNLEHATVRVVNDNTQIFRQVRDGAGDVMFTDDVEAYLQASCHPTLCVALEQSAFAPFQIAALFPKIRLWFPSSTLGCAERRPKHGWKTSLPRPVRKNTATPLSLLPNRRPGCLCTNFGAQAMECWPSFSIGNQVGNRIARVIFCFAEGHMVLLHGSIEK